MFIRRLRTAISERRRRRFARRVFESEFLDPDDLATAVDALQARDDADPPYDGRRIAITAGWIRHFGLDEGRVVDIGSSGHPVSDVLWDLLSLSPETTAIDLRTERLPFEDGSVDSVVCLEVIEHLSDVPYAHATTLSGVQHFLSEVHRVLRTGGRALITTPNAASYWNVRRALDQQPPMAYEWHFREFTVAELTELLEATGFDIDLLHTEFVWHLWGFRDIERLAARHAGTEHRGDDIFVVVSKGDRDSRPVGLDLPKA